MIVLAAIGRFFKKIWDWIKQTAWIQPLLIVGIIFGVIFSIPSISQAIKDGKAKRNKYENYYNKYQLSLELDDSNNEKSSPADKFTFALEDVMLAEDRDAAVTSFKKQYSDLGEKFFVVYFGKDCTKCKEAKDGFELFSEKLNNDAKFETKHKNDEFHMVTIRADEETSYSETGETAFAKYLGRHTRFFEEVGSIAEETPYAEEHLSDEDIEYLGTADPNNFLTPTIFLVELRADDNQFGAGVSEVMFGVSGSDENEKALTLLDCWNHEGDFSYND